MGSWSVSCGISNITITCGDDCVLLPLKKNNGSYGYYKYIPAMLPIFGKYNDYGEIEDIIETDNTKAISEYFGISIGEFANILVNGKHTYDRSEAKELLKEVSDGDKSEELSSLRFMWINRKVYDFMINPVDVYHNGYMKYGTPEILGLLGFTKEESPVVHNYDPKRFSQKWFNGKISVYSDGNTMLSDSGKYIYHFGKGSENSIETYVDVPKALDYLKDLHEHQAWRLMSKRSSISTLFSILGERDYSIKLETRKLFERFSMDEMKELGFDKEREGIIDRYAENIDSFGDGLSDLLSIAKNLHPMSGTFRPHELYLTPQCGEFSDHQKILDKFAEINRGILAEFDLEE